MSTLRRTTITASLCAGLALTVGCQSDSGGVAQPLPPVEASTTPSESTSPSPSSSPTEPPTPAWQDKYTKQQIAAYEAALDRFATYEQRAEPIWRRGKATPAAEELFKEYFFTWPTQLRTLKTYEQVNVEVHGTPTVLSSRGTRIVLENDSESVTIRQCIDYNTSQLLQDGEEAPGKPQTPRVRVIDLSRSVGANQTQWRIAYVNTFEGKRQC